MSGSTYPHALLGGALVLFAAIFQVPATAGVLYDEAVDGDLQVHDSTNLLLGIGVNQVKGSAKWVGDDFAAGLDSDSFHFTLATGAVLDRINYVVTALTLEPGNIALGMRWRLIDDLSGTTLASDGVDVMAGGNPAFFASLMPMTTTGSYKLFNNGMSRDGDGGAWDYTIEFVVTSAVPLPLTLTLFVPGLLAIAIAGRRRRTA